MNEKKTKIVCTIGPSSWDPAVMEHMITEGMNCARVNGAFADPDELDKVKKLVRDVSEDVNLMVDVKGPEVRMNKFDEAIQLTPGDSIEIGNSEEHAIYPANYPNLHEFVKEGQRILVGDGDVELRVKEIRDSVMYTKVVYGERLLPGKALNLPGADYASDVLTDKDKTNLKHAIKTGWDSVSASFMTDAKAAHYVRTFLNENGGEEMQLIAKIEDSEGVDNIDEILEVVDGVMVARGGLGVELGLERVPIAQRILIQRCNEVGKPVIVATQMLETMISNPRPTRAEVNDVATAVILGADAVMLSAESSAGKYPVEAVKTLTSVTNEANAVVSPEIIYERGDASITADTLARAAAEICINAYGIDTDTEAVDKVLMVSRSGGTVRLLARHNISQPIYAYVSSDIVKRKLMLNKGVYAVGVQESFAKDRDDAVTFIVDRAKLDGYVEKGERILLVFKTPISGEFYVPNIFEIVTVQ